MVKEESPFFRAGSRQVSHLEDVKKQILYLIENDKNMEDIDQYNDEELLLKLQNDYLEFFNDKNKETY